MGCIQKYQIYWSFMLLKFNKNETSIQRIVMNSPISGFGTFINAIEMSTSNEVSSNRSIIVLKSTLTIKSLHINKNSWLKYTTGHNLGTTYFSMIAQIILILILCVMKNALLIMWKSSKLYLKWIQNEVVLLNFEEFNAKNVKISIFS